MVTYFTCPKRGVGFTLVELILVIVVVAILASVVLPRLVVQGPRIKEIRLQRDLLMIRSAIERFEQDCHRFPRDLGELDDTSPASDLPPKASWAGPYLETIPLDINGKDWASGGWSYDPHSGRVTSASPERTLDGRTTHNQF